METINLAWCLISLSPDQESTKRRTKKEENKRKEKRREKTEDVIESEEFQWL